MNKRQTTMKNKARRTWDWLAAISWVLAFYLLSVILNDLEDEEVEDE